MYVPFCSSGSTSQVVKGDILGSCNVPRISTVIALPDILSLRWMMSYPYLVRGEVG